MRHVKDSSTESKFYKKRDTMDQVCQDISCDVAETVGATGVCEGLQDAMHRLSHGLPCSVALLTTTYSLAASVCANPSKCSDVPRMRCATHTRCSHLHARGMQTCLVRKVPHTHVAPICTKGAFYFAQQLFTVMYSFAARVRGDSSKHRHASHQPFRQMQAFQDRSASDI